MLKNIAMAAVGVLMGTAAMAQSSECTKPVFQKNNWFLTAGATTEAWMNTDGYVLGTGKIGAGVWINPWLGLKLEGVAGNTHLLTDSRGQVFGAHLSYMAHIYGGKKYNWFSLNGVLGGGFYHYKSGTIFKDHSIVNTINGNVGVQAVFNITPKWSLYLQPDLVVQPKYYDLPNKDDLALTGALTVGVNYTFKDKFSGLQKPGVAQAEQERLNREVNSMREEIATLNQQLEDQKAATAAAQQLAQQKPASVQKTNTLAEYTAFFRINSSILSMKEVVNLEAIAKVIKENPDTRYVITGYADEQTGSAAVNERISRERAEAVYNTLADRFGVSKEQLSMENKTVADLYKQDPKLSRAAVIRQVK